MGINNINEGDLIVLTVAMIQKYGITDTMQLEGKWLKEAQKLITKRGKGHVTLAFTSDPQGEQVNITCLFEDAQREEWARMGMTNVKMGEA